MWQLAGLISKPTSEHAIPDSLSSCRIIWVGGVVVVIQRGGVEGTTGELVGWEGARVAGRAAGDTQALHGGTQNPAGCTLAQTLRMLMAI